MAERKYYIDWMKALGMLTIIWGHCFPDGMSDFIYAFNVPVFFVISGYLSRRDEPLGQCFRKVWDGLLLPYLLLAFIKCAGAMLKHLDDGQWLWSVGAILGGFHSLGDAAGCSNLWFVYTLIVVKLLFCVMPQRRGVLLSATVVSLALALAYNIAGCEWYWAVADALLAVPFFLLGNMLSHDWREAFDGWLERLRGGSRLVLCGMVLALALVVYAVAWANGSVKMYVGSYGQSLPLFLLGGVAGSLMVLLLSLLLEGFRWRGVLYVNMGMLVTLTFHRELLHPLLKLLRDTDFNLVVENLIIFCFALAVWLAFIPITMLVRRLLPWVLGVRRICAVSDAIAK